MHRERFDWDVTLQRDDGQMVAHRISNYWAPGRDDTATAVGLAARAEAHIESGKRHEFHPVKIERAAA